MGRFEGHWGVGPEYKGEGGCEGMGTGEVGGGQGGSGGVCGGPGGSVGVLGGLWGSRGVYGGPEGLTPWAGQRLPCILGAPLCAGAPLLIFRWGGVPEWGCSGCGGVGLGAPQLCFVLGAWGGALGLLHILRGGSKEQKGRGAGCAPLNLLCPLCPPPQNNLTSKLPQSSSQQSKSSRAVGSGGGSGGGGHKERWGPS